MDNFLKKLYNDNFIIKEYYEMVQDFSKGLNFYDAHMLDSKAINIRTDKGVLGISYGGLFCSFDSNEGDLHMIYAKYKNPSFVSDEEYTTLISLYDQDGLYFMSWLQNIDKNSSLSTGRPSIYYFDLDTCSRIIDQKLNDSSFANKPLVNYIGSNIDKLKKNGIYPTEEITNASEVFIPIIPTQRCFEARENKELFKKHIVQTLEINKKSNKNYI